MRRRRGASHDCHVRWNGMQGNGREWKGRDKATSSAVSEVGTWVVTYVCVGLGHDLVRSVFSKSFMSNN